MNLYHSPRTALIFAFLAAAMMTAAVAANFNTPVAEHVSAGAVERSLAEAEQMDGPGTRLLELVTTTTAAPDTTTTTEPVTPAPPAKPIEVTTTTTTTTAPPTTTTAPPPPPPPPAPAPAPATGGVHGYPGGPAPVPIGPSHWSGQCPITVNGDVPGAAQVIAEFSQMLGKPIRRGGGDPGRSITVRSGATSRSSSRAETNFHYDNNGLFWAEIVVSPMGLGQIDTLRHEFGHAFGLHHSSGGLMGATVAGSRGVTTFSELEVQWFRNFGARSC